MGAPQAISLASGALLVTLIDYHVILAIMAALTGAAVVYLLVLPERQLSRLDGPLTAPTDESGPSVGGSASLPVA
jgi:hypothetical protein